VSPDNRKPGKTGTPAKRGKAVNIYLHDADQVRIRRWPRTWRMKGCG
jgi:hypothetical protein